MKAISIKLEVPEWIAEAKFAARLKRIAEKIVYPEKLSAEEVRTIFGAFEEEIEPVNVRKKEKERIKWLYPHVSSLWFGKKNERKREEECVDR